ncbi:hypothetical protein HMSSN036_28870 [Paenibacillus macerans]|nr:hypothetical protein HMSSN036_28870 [Paenibacillus macerans]
MIGNSPENVEQRVELVVLRELSITVGRLAGTLLFIVIYSLYPRMSTITWLMFGLGATPILSWLALRKQLKKAPTPSEPGGRRKKQSSPLEPNAEKGTKTSIPCATVQFREAHLEWTVFLCRSLNFM